MKIGQEVNYKGLVGAIDSVQWRAVAGCDVCYIDQVRVVFPDKSFVWCRINELELLNE